MLTLAICFGPAAMTGLGSEGTRAEALLGVQRPLVIAHRGYSAFAPENTMAAFRLANAAGADLVELDYHHTQDDVPIVIHDGTLDRTTDATNRWGGRKLAVAAYRLGALRELNAGAWFGGGWGGMELGLPTLAEAIAFIQEGGVTLVERKGGEAGTLARLLRERSWVNSLVVQAFDWDFLRQLHELEPGQVLGALGPAARLADGREPEGFEKPLSEAWLAEVRKTGARVVVWNREVSEVSVRLAHELGLKVWVYTINDAGLADRLLHLGVDGLITDNPSMAWRVLAVRGWGGTGGVQEQAVK
jgi:glycerophosphoryl diester phosphodiesterase